MKIKKTISLIVLSLSILLSFILVSCHAHTHVYENWKVTIKPTETTTGEISRICSHDGNIETDVLPILIDSAYTIYTIDPTCTEKGSKTYKYYKDSQELTVATVDIDALGHNYGEWSVTKEPTDNAAGEISRTCSKDGNLETAILPKLNDTDYTVESIGPTCTQKGSIVYDYIKDGQTLSITIDVDSLGHDYGKYFKTTKPTLESKGLLTRTCSRCNEKDTLELPILNRNDYIVVVRLYVVKLKHTNIV